MPLPFHGRRRMRGLTFWHFRSATRPRIRLPHYSGLSSLRPGFSLLELMLFLAIFSIMCTTIVAVFISSQDARIRQQSIAALEQRSGQILQLLSRRIRRAEKVLSPAAGHSATLLQLQMASDTEFPTIFSLHGANMYFVEQNQTPSLLLSDQIAISNLAFKNIGDTSVTISFDLSIVVPLPASTTYKRHFEDAVTLFPVDSPQSGGCVGGCAVGNCNSNRYTWKYCDTSACKDSNPNNFVDC